MSGSNSRRVSLCARSRPGNRACGKPGRQRGVALLTALLVVALALLLITALLQHGEVQRARTGYQLRHEQAWQLARGMEAWAADTLDDAYRRQPGIDGFDDPWLQAMPPIPVPGGQISGQLHDLGGCFNVNSLIRDAADDPRASARFARLLQAVGADENFLEVLLDWLDADYSARAGGAEDGLYASRGGYLAANTVLVDPSELRLLSGVDDALLRRLVPLVCALPQDQTINLNTAEPELWMALDARITSAMAKQLALDGHARYPSIDAVRAALQRLGLEQVDLEGTAVGSRYFRAEIRVESDGTPYRFSALIDRGEGRARVVARWQGG